MDNEKIKNVEDKILGGAMLVGSMVMAATAIGCAKLYNKALELRKDLKEKEEK